jgi:hypothetical protein
MQRRKFIRSALPAAQRCLQELMQQPPARGLSVLESLIFIANLR